MNVWVGWHKLHDGQSDIPIFQWKHEADKWVSQYKPGFAKLITLTEQKPWVGLTDDEIKEIIKRECRYTREAANTDHQHLCYAIEAKLKKKNT